MAVTLPPELIQRLRDGADEIAKHRQEIARAKRAGIDTAELEAQLDGMDKLRKGLLQTYGVQLRSAR